MFGHPDWGQELTGSKEAQAFGRYRLRGVLREGGMGRLFLAEQTGVEGFVKIIVVKRILPHLAHDPHIQRLFLKEARIAARLEHPNIVATYELGDVDGEYFLSMEYLPGEVLSSILARSRRADPIPVANAVYVAQQVANGLHYAHGMQDANGRPVGLVHRDVNPQNIVVTYFGAVKLLDFGVSKSSEGPPETAPGTFKGNFSYCAPEQIDGGPVDNRTDVFCLGIVLWESLTGRSLFGSDSEGATLDAVRTRRIDPPGTMRFDVPRELDEIVLTALARDSSLRYPSAHDMSEALGRLLQRRGERPTPGAIAAWLHGLFGEERASLKKAIAQGAESALMQVRTTSFFRDERDEEGTPATVATGPRTQSASFPPPGSDSQGDPRASPQRSPRTQMMDAPPDAVDEPTPTTRPGRRTARGTAAPASRTAAGGAFSPRTIVLLAGVAALGVLAFVLQLVHDHARSSSLQVRPVASLEVQSDPPGAHIFVDGDPSGLTTPAVLSHLPVGRSIEIRLDKRGYEPATKHFSLSDDGNMNRESYSVVLRPAVGELTLVGLPRHAAIFLDDRPVNRGSLRAIAKGLHSLRVEAAQDLVFSGTVDIVPGQRVVVAIGRRNKWTITTPDDSLPRTGEAISRIEPEAP
ncbi:MAG TPA: protein kinase [Polyangia bacterium]|nr:protein kinase [Polyangia bacterium]